MSTLQEAIAEAYASAPDDELIYDALEIDHPSFLAPARVVNWPVTGPKPEIFMFLHEDTAPLDPNKSVEYIGIPFEIIPPESSDSNAGTFQIQLTLSDDFDKYLEAAATNPGVIKANYRQYIQGREQEGPGVYWYDLTITSPRREGGTIIADAAVLTWSMEPYGDLYLPTDYPALVSGR